MSGAEPDTPEPKTISVERPTPITSMHSDGNIPTPEGTELRTFGMSTSVRMEETIPSAASVDKDIASDLADLSDTGAAPPSAVRRILVFVIVCISAYMTNIGTSSSFRSPKWFWSSCVRHILAACGQLHASCVQDRMQLSVYSQGVGTSDDGNDGGMKGSVASGDEGRATGGGHSSERVQAWVQENMYNGQ